MRPIMRRVFKAFVVTWMFLVAGLGGSSVFAAEADAAAALAMQNALALQAAQQAAALQQAALQNAAAAQQAATQQAAAKKSAATVTIDEAAPVTAPANSTVDSVKAGGTYIDVNKTTQTLSLVVGGQVTYITPIVTGNVRAGHSTPNGVYNVYAKQTNRVLKGPNYESFVKYWMPFYKGYGIHDANWRSSGEFGGTTYQTSGSHGCVNIPPANMPSLFAAVAVGTPVIVHE